MFDLVGIERFWYADQMAALMPELLAEKPGAFLPYRTDSEMLELAEKEKKGRVQLQLGGTIGILSAHVGKDGTMGVGSTGVGVPERLQGCKADE